LELGGLMLGLLDRFRKKKGKEKINVETSPTMTELEQLCGDDKGTYEALIHAMFLDPRKIGISIKDAMGNAKQFEKAKDSVRARAMYEIAGGLAVYEGDLEKVVEFFSKCEELLPDVKYPILKNPEKAIAVAQEYYKKYLKA
jgi:hypothetical protein